MNELYKYNDQTFSYMYSKYHPNDNTLVCRDNTLYYLGENKSIYGSCEIKNNESVYLPFMVGTIDIPIWNQEPHVIFFLIREIVNAENLDKEKFYENFPDKYMALKMYESLLRGKLLTYYIDVTTNIIDAAKKVSTSDMSEGFKIIYERMFNNAKDNESASYSNADGGENRGISRTRNSGFKPKPSIIPMITSDEAESNKSIKDAAFANILMIIFITVVTIAIVLMLIFA